MAVFDFLGYFKKLFSALHVILGVCNFRVFEILPYVTFGMWGLLILFKWSS